MSSAMPIRSLHVGISWATEGAGGSGRVFADLARHLPAAGVDFRGAVSAPANAAELTAGTVRCFVQPGRGFAGKLLGARQRIQQEIVQHRPHLIASHFALFAAPALDLLRQQPHVVHFHGPWAAESVEEGEGWLASRVKYALERAVYRRADRIIVLSRAFAKVAEEDYGIDPGRIHIVPGAVDFDRFAISATRSEARASLGWPAEGSRRILVAVRRLVQRMGLRNLIQALRMVAARHPDVLLYIAGKGRLREKLEAQIIALGLQDHVKLLGFVSDAQLPVIYRAADINVVPTLSLEGFGLVAAEAIAAGTPSMVTPVGGLPEVVSALSAQLVFASCHPEAIAAGLLAALEGSIALPSESACRQFAMDHFSASLMARRTAAVYRQLL